MSINEYSYPLADRISADLVKKPMAHEKSTKKQHGDSPVLLKFKQDYFHAWRLLRENYRAFIWTGLFAFFAMFITISIIVLIIFAFISVFPSDLSMESIIDIQPQGPPNGYMFLLIFIIPSTTILSAFLNCQHGLAFDIMSSGEMFAEFRGAFIYFKRFWWQYSLMSIILLGINPIFRIIMGGLFQIRLNDVYMDPTLFYIGVIEGVLFFFWFILFIHAFPGLTETRRFIPSIKKSLQIFRHDFKHIALTWGVYFGIVMIPLLLAEILLYLNVASYANFIFVWLFFLIVVFFAFPMRSLLARGIYNNFEDPVEKEQKLDEIKR